MIYQVFVQFAGQYSVRGRFLYNLDVDVVHDASTVLKPFPNPDLLRLSILEDLPVRQSDIFYFVRHFFSFEKISGHSGLRKTWTKVSKTFLKLLDSSGYPILVSLS